MGALGSARSLEQVRTKLEDDIYIALCADAGALTSVDEFGP